jgi:hypothetical protein
VGEDPPDLGWGEAGVDRDQHQVEGGGGEAGGQVERRVGRQQGDAIAGGAAARGQESGQGAGVGVDRGIVDVENLAHRRLDRGGAAA